MKISDLEFTLVEGSRDDGLPLRSLLICLTTDSGKEGWGEAPLPWRPTELSARRDALLPMLATRSIFDIAELLELESLRDPALACAVEIAVWDLIGQMTDLPISHLLGGSYRQHVPLAVRLPSSNHTDPVQVARELLDHGFPIQVLTASGDFNRDLQLVRALWDVVGQRAEIHLDGCEKFSLEDSRALCAELEEQYPCLLIDPLNRRDLETTASLARQTNIPLGLARAIRTPRDVMATARSSVSKHLIVDLHRVGGITAARKCAAVAEAGGLTIALAVENSLGISTAAMLQTAAATPVFSSGNLSDYWQLKDDVLSYPLEILDGMLTSPQAAGLGIEVDREKVERLQVS